jgi:hypothetical protein
LHRVHTTSWRCRSADANDSLRSYASVSLAEGKLMQYIDEALRTDKVIVKGFKKHTLRLYNVDTTKYLIDSVITTQ